MRDLNSQPWYAKYKKFKVGNAATNFKLEIAGYTGTAGESLSYHNSMLFTITDANNEAWA